MFHSHLSDIAIAFTGGIDSSVLAHYVCKTLDTLDNFVLPVPTPETHRTRVVLLACNYGQANWHITNSLALEHQILLRSRYKDKVSVSYAPIDVKFPTWQNTNTGLFAQNFVPPRQDEIIDKNEQVRTYDYAFVEGRNMLLFFHMLSYCSTFKIPILLTGYQNEENEWRNLDAYRYRTEDFGPMFMDRINLLQECGFSFRVRVDAPFLSMRLTKYNIVQLAKELNLDIGSLSYSCQFIPACGKCDNCVIRRKVFGLLDVKEGFPNEKTKEA